MFQLDSKRLKQNKHNPPSLIEVSKQEKIQIRLIYYRAKELPPYHNVALGECIKIDK